MTDTNLQKYDGVAMLLHWVTAVLMIVMIFFGEDLMGEGEEAGEAAGAAVKSFKIHSKLSKPGYSSP